MVRVVFLAAAFAAISAFSAPEAPASAQESAAITPESDRQTLEGIAAIVNDKPISYSDVRQRARLLLLTIGASNPTQEQVQQITSQALEQLVDAIQAVAGGGSLVQPAVTQRLLSGLEHMRNEFVSLDRPDPLTDRETEILRLMASGFSNKEIANSLGVAEGTIKNHVSNILSKLGVRDRTRAVLKAFELQLV